MERENGRQLRHFKSWRERNGVDGQKGIRPQGKHTEGLGAGGEMRVCVFV